MTLCRKLEQSMNSSHLTKPGSVTNSTLCFFSFTFGFMMCVHIATCIIIILPQCSSHTWWGLVLAENTSCTVGNFCITSRPIFKEMWFIDCSCTHTIWNVIYYFNQRCCEPKCLLVSREGLYWDHCCFWYTCMWMTSACDSLSYLLDCWWLCNLPPTVRCCRLCHLAKDLSKIIHLAQ